MKFRFIIFTGLLLASFLATGRFAWAQERQYELIPAPDLWYNDVDGVRVGVRVLGQRPGTFEDGPHRLDAGIWLGTWIPDYPVSYYISFTEPIPSISGFNSEGNIQAVSSIRTGFSIHKIVFNKRWQPGFDEQNFSEISLEAGIQQRFEKMYVPFPGLWQENRLALVRGRVSHQAVNGSGRHSLSAKMTANLAGSVPGFLNFSGEVQQAVLLGSGFSVKGRLFLGITSNDTPPEFLFTHSLQPAAEWVERGVTRAKGTVPVSWMESGLFQVSGGANLRGYTDQDIEAILQGIPPLFTSMGSFNAEIDYPNPIDRAIERISIIGNLLDLRSYIFFDIGTTLGLTGVEETNTLADAGLGFTFSLNIPDYLGKPRGFMLRYDIPLWLSDPKGEQNFSYRNIIGIGAVFSL